MSIFTRQLHIAVAAAAFVAASGSVLLAQMPVESGATAPRSSIAPAIASLRPAVAQVGEAVASLRIEHWKAPNDVRASSESDAESIQRDLTSTLPPLLDRAQAASSATGALAPSVAVYRNIDALYDVLLRITEMANMAGSEAEAVHLEDARAALESARGQLAGALLESVTAQDTELDHFRAQAAAVPKPVAAPPSTEKIVVDDGPEVPKRHSRKKKAAPKKVAPSSSSSSPQ